MTALADQVAQALHLKTGDRPLVDTAALELASSPLHQQIQQVAERAKASGYSQLQVLPLFLLPGVHVMEDIPAEVAIAQQHLGESFYLKLRPFLGKHPQLPELLKGFDPQVALILLAHGSRRLGGNQPVEAIAAQLSALPAYWSVPPSLETQVSRLIQQGHSHISIQPYFLFEGGITDAIAQTVQQLRQQFPAVQLHLASPFGTTPELARLIVDLS